jgi:hypothetical protein
LCEDLKLPPKNEFIPTDFDLMPREENVSIVYVIVILTFILQAFNSEFWLLLLNFSAKAL